MIDFGCDTGGITVKFAERGFGVVGVDLSDCMLEIARQKHPEIDFISADMNEYVPEGGLVDTVVYSYSFFHIPKNESLKSLLHANKILRSGGKLLIVLQEGHGEVMIDEPLDPSHQVHVALYTSEEFSELLTRAEFKVLTIAPKYFDVTHGELQYNKLFVIAQKNS